MLLTLEALQDYRNWVGQTVLDVHNSVIRVGGWQNVFPGVLPRWASRIRQYFNLTPMTLKRLDDEESRRHRAKAQTAPREAKLFDRIGTEKALSDYVYEDVLGRSIWFQMDPGGGVYHFGEKLRSPTKRAFGAWHAGQKFAPVFKLVCPDGTGGSREVCIQNIFDVPHIIRTRIDGDFTYSKGHTAIGAVNEQVNVAGRIVMDSVSQGSYNYAETIVKGLAAHQRLDVHTDPMKPGYYVEPSNLFQFSELYMRRFPENDQEGKSLVDQSGPAP